MDRILKMLVSNARLTAKEIADRIGGKPAEIREKIRKYEENGLIHGYTAVLDDKAYGKEQVRAIIEVKITPTRDGGFDSVAKRIAKFPEVEELCLVSGSYDLLLAVRGNSLTEVAGFVASKLATIDGVISCSTGFQLKKYKSAGRIMEDDENYERLKICP
ncbi:MAG: Lrp/AsnC family transcriptional regulator [Victivallaceae bacterium]|nr:Lrp/AsnC family transcriptional regulator [Victivallaceae bacterium]